MKFSSTRKLLKNTALIVLGVLLLPVYCKSNKGAGTPVQQGKQVVIDTAFNVDDKNMRMNILSTSINKDLLTIEINYSGGCIEHSFSLYSTKEFSGSNNDELQLFLVDEQKEDFCKMLLTDTLLFDLSNIKTKGVNPIQIKINRQDQTIKYHY
jgi:hypothetical protein